MFFWLLKKELKHKFQITENPLNAVSICLLMPKSSKIISTWQHTPSLSITWKSSLCFPGVSELSGSRTDGHIVSHSHRGVRKGSQSAVSFRAQQLQRSPVVALNFPPDIKVFDEHQVRLFFRP